MTSSQVIYLVAVSVYVVFFLLFARFFIWKRYADSRFWHRRPVLTREKIEELARARGREVPRFSVIIPARNEAEVIGRTIDHLLTLDYDPARYEVVIVSDEKETLARDIHRSTVLSAAAALLDPDEAPQDGMDAAHEVILGLLARFAVLDYNAGRREYRRLTIHMTHDMGEPELHGLVTRHVAAVASLARRLVTDTSPLSLGELRLATRAAMTSSSQRENDLVASVHLALAVPVAVALGLVTRRAEPLEAATVVGRTGQAREEVTARILTVMSGVIARSLAKRLETERSSGRLAALLRDSYTLRFPTTQDIVEERIANLGAMVPGMASASRPAPAARFPGPAGGGAAPRAKSLPALPKVKHLVVPYDFDGAFPGRCLGSEVPSTKGRALNWALSFTDPKSEAYGFYDAESRPDRKVLLYVALRRLSGDPSAAILQGPVFQVRNFFRMGPLCKVACLYQAIAHDWYLPALFRRLPFVGGTNLFVDRGLLERAGGFDAGALTEDLELGVRAYLKCGAWPEFLPYPSSEQTPPTLAGFFRQRLRWGSGHLQVMDKVRRAEGYESSHVSKILRTLWLKGQFEWVVYQCATLIPPAVMVLYATGNVDPTVLPHAAKMALNTLSLLYPCFTFYAYFRYYRFIDPLDRDPGPLAQFWVCIQLLVLPLAAFCFPVPYTVALILKRLGREPRVWIKTPRTAE